MTPHWRVLLSAWAHRLTKPRRAIVNADIVGFCTKSMSSRNRKIQVYNLTLDSATHYVFLGERVSICKSQSHLANPASAWFHLGALVTLHSASSSGEGWFIFSNSPLFIQLLAETKTSDGETESRNGLNSAYIHFFVCKELEILSTHEAGGRCIASNWVGIKLTWVYKMEMTPVVSPHWAAVKLFLPGQTDDYRTIRNISSLDI